MLGGLRARPGQAAIPLTDVDCLPGLLGAGRLLKLRLVRPITADAPEAAAAAGAASSRTARGDADGEDGEGDDTGDDEGEGGGEESVQGAGVALCCLQAPVTAVHRAAYKP